MKRSRLSRQLERKTKKTIFFSVIGIIIVFIVVFKLAIPLLINASLFVTDFKDSRETAKKTQSYVPEPFLDAQPNATNGAEINITGTAAENDIVDLYINDNFVDKVKVEKDNKFKFEEVLLSDGENTIKAQAVRDRSKSSFSSPLTIALIKKAPTLEINSPSDNQSFSKDEKNIEIKGKTQAGAKVTVNDFWAIVDSEGYFSYSFSLKDGENKIKIISVDEAGNKKELELKVTYSP